MTSLEVTTLRDRALGALDFLIEAIRALGPRDYRLKLEFMRENLPQHWEEYEKDLQDMKNYAEAAIEVQHDRAVSIFESEEWQEWVSGPARRGCKV